MVRKPEDNLLLALWKWADRQDENFTTDAFAHLLRSIVDTESQVGMRLLNRLADNWLGFDGEQCTGIRINTQETIETGRVDIQLSAPGRLAIIEVKVESDVGDEQLTKYRTYLEKRQIETTKLILLTRYPIPDELREKADSSKRWHEVAGWLEQLLNSPDLTSHEALRFLIREFVDFLRARRMTMEQVGWQLVEGIKSMLSLLDILEQALGSAKAKVTKTQAWNGGCGHSFTAQKREFWLGLRYSRPDSVAFEAYGVDKDRADKVGSGEVEKWGDGYRWRCWVNLASEEVHFFARPISDQIRYLENFVRKSIEAANNLFAD